MIDQGTIWSETLVAYLHAFENKTAAPPEIDSVWYDEVRDDYILPWSLATKMLARFVEGAGPWSLEYPLRFGTLNEQDFAKQQFCLWRDLQPLDEEFGDWVRLVPYFVKDDPTLLSLIKYRKGDILELALGSDSREYWATCMRSQLPVAVDDLIALVDYRLTGTDGAADDLLEIYSILDPLGRSTQLIIGREHMLQLRESLVEIWRRSRKRAVESNFESTGLTADVLRWCWRFGWEETFLELIENESFLGDCFFSYKDKSIMVPSIENTAQNICATSLMSPGASIVESLSEIGLIRGFMDKLKNCFERSSPRDSVKIVEALERVAWGAQYPSEVADGRERLRQTLPDLGTVEIGSALHAQHCCIEIWKLRLAFAIARRRMAIRDRR